MKQGEIIESFTVTVRGKQQEIIFRFPKSSDAKQALSFINNARKEASFLGVRRMETIKSEQKFLSETFKAMAKRRKILVFADAGGKIIGDASISVNSAEARSHVGEFGIALREQFTSQGIGTRLGKCVLRLAKKELKLKIIVSFFFSKNKRSRALHKKLGFKECGLVPNGCSLKNNKYDDEVRVYKVI